MITIATIKGGENGILDFKLKSKYMHLQHQFVPRVVALCQKNQSQHILNGENDWQMHFGVAFSQKSHDRIQDVALLFAFQDFIIFQKYIYWKFLFQGHNLIENLAVLSILPNKFLMEFFSAIKV